MKEEKNKEFEPMVKRPRKGECKVEGCNVVHNAKGYCKRHYWRYMKYGDTLVRRNRFEIIEKLSEVALEYIKRDRFESGDNLQPEDYKMIEDIKKGMF